ncbi:MAG: hypothetical protein JST00_31995 [Deltaproteobacteria bacterium]|nr:hypothetical protein [Deltaproteobacteria bacterium]
MGIHRRRAGVAIAGTWILLATAAGVWSEACIDTSGLAGDAGGGGDAAVTEPATEGGGGAGDAGDAGVDAFVGCGPKNIDCLGGACEAGVCVSVRLTAKDPDAGPALDIALFGPHFYYLEAQTTSRPSTIIRCPKEGGCLAERKVIATIPTTVPPTDDHVLAVRADGVYYYSPETGGVAVARAAIDGTGTPTVLTPVVGDASEQIVVQGNHVYYTGSGKVWACPITGCRPPSPGPVALATVANRASGMAFYDGQLVYTEKAEVGAGARVVRMQLDGGGAAEYTPPPRYPRWVTVEPSRGVVVASFPDTSSPAKIALFSGTSYYYQVYEANLQYITVAADKDYVYFTQTAPQELHRKKWEALETEKVVAGYPFGLALDDKAIYYTHAYLGEESGVLRRPK